MAFDLYEVGALPGLASVWGNAGSEIDLRDEMHNFLFGEGAEIPKGQMAVIRRARLDSTGHPVKCQCVSKVTNEPDRDTPCCYCWGCGWMWDEEWVTTYKSVVGRVMNKARLEAEKPGTLSLPIVYFFFEYGVQPGLYDMIIEVERDPDGNVIYPVVRKTNFKIGALEPLRSDNGRIEFMRVSASEITVKTHWDTR